MSDLELSTLMGYWEAYNKRTELMLGARRVNVRLELARRSRVDLKDRELVTTGFILLCDYQVWTTCIEFVKLSSHSPVAGRVDDTRQENLSDSIDNAQGVWVESSAEGIGAHLDGLAIALIVYIFPAAAKRGRLRLMDKSGYNIVCFVL